VARARAGYGSVVIYIPEELYQELRHYAVDEREGLSKILSEAAAEWWKAHPKREGYRKAPAKESIPTKKPRGKK
jgi:hypothetical protein